MRYPAHAGMEKRLKNVVDGKMKQGKGFSVLFCVSCRRGLC